MEASEEQRLEVPPPQTFFIHRKPPPASTTSQPATLSHHHITRNAASTITASQPKKATHFTIKTLFEDVPLAPDLAPGDVADDEDMAGNSNLAPLTATPSSMQLLAAIGGKRGKGKAKGEIGGSAEGEMNAAYALAALGSQNGKRKITKKGMEHTPSSLLLPLFRKQNSERLERLM